MTPKNKTRWLNSTILGFGLASFFSDLGHEMATAAMPALLASVGAGSAALGLIEGVADGFSSFAKLISGVYSDRLQKRKPLAVAGYFITASAMASFAIATQWWHVLLGRVIGWIGRGARSPVRNVLLTEATTPQTCGQAFGLERAMDSAGAVLGPALALFLIAMVGIRWTFAVTLIPGLIAALFIIFMVKEKARFPQPHVNIKKGIGSLPASFKRFLLGVGIAGIGDFSNTLLILWATQAFGARLGMTKGAIIAIAFYVFYNVVYTVFCYVSGLLADRFPKQEVLAVGYVIAVIPAIALMFPGASYVKFAVIFGFSGVYMGIWETVQNSTAAVLLPESVRGTGFGILATVNGIGDLISSSIVGFLWMVAPLIAMTFVVMTTLIGAAIIGSSKIRQV